MLGAGGAKGDLRGAEATDGGVDGVEAGASRLGVAAGQALEVATGGGDRASRLGATAAMADASRALFKP